MITISEPHYLMFYSADCKYTAVIRQRLEMPHLSIMRNQNIYNSTVNAWEDSVLRLFDILGGIHSKLEKSKV